MRYFEDIMTGEVHQLGPRSITLEDSLRFCEEFDRLPFHLDSQQASESIYGELIASGLHTLALTASIVVDGLMSQTSMTGASGMGNVRWHRPVTLPNELCVTVTVLDKSPPKPGKPFGVVTCELETIGQGGALMMTAVVDHLLAVRPQL